MNNGTASLPIFKWGDGTRFLSSYQEPIVESPWDGQSDEEIAAFVIARWKEAYEAKRPETARLIQNSTAYDGFRRSAWDGFEGSVENRIYEMVETLVANSIIAKPRPELQPMRTMDAERVNRVQAFATWYMDTSEWDRAKEMSTRDKKIFGWAIRIITIDYATGMPYPKPYSVYDYYPDPSGLRDDDRSYWILAGPKNTNRLRATYPKAAENIIPDNIASPSYDAIDRRWYEFLEGGVLEFDHPMVADSGLAVHQEGETPTTTTTLVQTTGEKRDHGTTTFTVQIIVRDDSMCDAHYWGTFIDPDGIETAGMKYVAKKFSRRSASGFWLLTVTSNGTLLHRPKQLDECYLGLPWVYEADEERTDAAWSRSPVDHVIPLQRELDDANFHLDNNLEFASNPPLKTNDSKLDAQLQQSPIAGGDTMLVQVGREAEYLTYPSPAAHHFARLADIRAGMRDIGAFQGALEGARQPGIEAASALRHLDDAAKRRLRAKENSSSRADALLLRKLLYCAGKKLQPEITFMATDGSSKSVTGDDLADLYKIRFAEGTGTVEGRLEREDKAFALYDRELIDEQAVLEEIQWPGAQEIAARMVDRKMEEKILMAASAAANAPPGGGAKKSSPAPAGR